jgi:hypothetical protein
LTGGRKRECKEKRHASGEKAAFSTKRKEKIKTTN